jgi:hypothetical protein
MWERPGPPSTSQMGSYVSDRPAKNRPRSVRHQPFASIANQNKRGSALADVAAESWLDVDDWRPSNTSRWRTRTRRPSLAVISTRCRQWDSGGEESVLNAFPALKKSPVGARSKRRDARSGQVTMLHRGPGLRRLQAPPGRRPAGPRVHLRPAEGPTRVGRGATLDSFHLQLVSSSPDQPGFGLVT